MKKAIVIITTLALMYGSYYVGTTRSKTIEKIVEVPVETKVEVPVEKVVEKIVEVPVEKVIKIPIEKTVQKTIEQKCEPQIIYNENALRGLESYVIATINSYPAEEAVNRIYDAIIIPEWKK